MFKRMVSFLLAVVLLVGVVPAQAFAAETEASVDTGAVSVEGGNAFGELVTEEITAWQDAQLSAQEEYEPGFSVTDLTFTGATATVTYDAMEEATLVVAVYTEDGLTLLNSAYKTVTPGETTATVTISGEMPQYFYAAAYLLDTYDLSPLCQDYSTPIYTQAMQDLLASTVADYPTDRVLKLEESNTTNFAVYGENTVIVEPQAGVNTVASANDETMRYVIGNADDQFTSLQPGDVVAYEYGDQQYIFAKVASIDISGTTVTIQGAELEMEDVFSHVKLEGTGNGEGATVDTSTASEGVRYTPDSAASASGGGIDGTFSHQFPFTFADGVLNSKLTLGLEAGFSFLKSDDILYTKLSMGVNIALEAAVELKYEKSFMLGRLTFPVAYGGISFSVTPSIVLGVSAKLNFSATVSSSMGFQYNTIAGFKPIQSTPALKTEVSVEGTIFLGIDLCPSIGLLGGLMGDIFASIPAGLEITAKNAVAETEYGKPEPQEDPEERHSCKECLEIKGDWKVDFDVGFRWLDQKGKEWNILGVKIAAGEGYYSIDHEEFGLGKCPYKEYKVTVLVRDGDNAAVSGAAVQTSSGGKVGESGITNGGGICSVYLEKGSHTIVAKSGELQKTVTEKVEEPKKVTIKLPSTPEEEVPEETKPSFPGGAMGDVESKPVGSSGRMISYGQYTNGLRWEAYEYKDAYGDWSYKKLIISGTGEMNNDDSGRGHEITYNDGDYLGDWYSKTTEEIDMWVHPSNYDEVVILDGITVINCSFWRQTWIGDRWSPSYITLPSTLREIGVGAFSSCDIRKIELPMGLEKIGDNAFSRCNLESIVIPGSVQQIGDNAFSRCEYLRQAVIGGAATEIGAGAFYDCQQLERVTIGEGIRKIGDAAFQNCTKLTGVQLPDALVVIGASAFDGSGLLEITIPGSVLEIGRNAFLACDKLKKVTILPGVECIGPEAFQGCSAVTTLNLPEGLKRIEAFAFFGYGSLTELTIPKTVEYIGEKAFGSCLSLKDLTFAGFDLTDGTEYPITLSNYAFEHCPVNQLELPAITDAYYPFAECEYVDTIVMDGCVYGGYPFAYLGETIYYPYAYCQASLPADDPEAANYYYTVDRIYSLAHSSTWIPYTVDAAGNMVPMEELAYTPNVDWGNHPFGLSAEADSSGAVNTETIPQETEAMNQEIATSVPDGDLLAMTGDGEATPGDDVPAMTEEGETTPGDDVPAMTEEGETASGDDVPAMTKEGETTPGDDLPAMTGEGEGSDTVRHSEADRPWESPGTIDPEIAAMTGEEETVPAETVAEETEPLTLAGLFFRRPGFLTAAPTALAEGVMELLLPEETNGPSKDGVVDQEIAPEAFPSVTTSVPDGDLLAITEEGETMPAEDLPAITEEGETTPAEDLPAMTGEGSGSDTICPSEADRSWESPGTIDQETAAPGDTLPAMTGEETIPEETLEATVPAYDAVFGGEYATEDMETYILTTASFSGLMPGKEYVLLALTSLEDPLSNLVHIDQGTASENGTLSFDYVEGDTSASYVIACGASNQNLNDASITLPVLYANGEEQVIDPTVVYGGRILTEDRDYTLSGQVSFTEPGEYTCCIRGIYEYTGTVQCTYTVQEAPGTQAPVELPKAETLQLFENDTDLSKQKVWTKQLTKDTANGFSIQLTAEVTPEDASDSLNWSSSDTTVATVASGKVTFTGKAGTVTITASTRDGSDIGAQVTYKVLAPTELEVVGESDIHLTGGKSTNLKVLNKDTGKAVAAKDIVWTLDAGDQAPSAFATISKTGKLTARQVLSRTDLTVYGDVYNKGSYVDTVVYTVTIYPAATHVELLDAEGSIVNGKTIPVDTADGTADCALTAKVYPLDAQEAVTWKSSSKAIADIDPVTGELTWKGKNGTVTITATTNDGSRKKAAVKLTFGALADGVTIGVKDKKEIIVAEEWTLTSGKSVQLAAELAGNPTNKKVIWTTDNPCVKVSGTGKVTAQTVYEETTAVITATAADGSGKSDTFTVTVQPKDMGMLILRQGDRNMTKSTIYVDMNTNNTTQLTAHNLTDGEAPTVEWKTSAKATATVENGTVTFLKAGSVTITATAEDGRKATVTLKAAKLASAVTITGAEKVASGKGITLKAACENAAGKQVTWSIEKGAEYAKISSSGKLTTNKDITSAQTVTVRATAKDGSGIYGEKEITIRPIAQGVQIYSQQGGRTVFSVRTSDSWWVRSNTTLEWAMNEEATIQLSSHVYPYYGDDDARNAIQGVTWKTSSKAVATVDENGLITCLKPGTVTITATANDGSNKKVTFKLKVVKKITELTMEDQTVKGGKTLNLAKLITINPGDATNKTLTWEITGGDGATYVTLNVKTGALKTKKVDSAKTVEITATAQDGSGAEVTFAVTIDP